MSTPPITSAETKQITSPVQNDKVGIKSESEAKCSATSTAINIKSTAEEPVSNLELMATEPFIKSEPGAENPINSLEPKVTESTVKIETSVKVEDTTEDQGITPDNGFVNNTDAIGLTCNEGKKEDESKAPNSGSVSGSTENKSMNKPKPTYPDGVLKTSARTKEGVSNSKYDPSVLPITDDPKKIRAQVEFYFGDANLPTDKHMRDLIEGSSNKPVPIKKICEFGRMRRFSPYSAIVSALKESKFLKVSGSEGEELVERKIPYDFDNRRNTVESRSIYAKGFGDEEPSSQFDIEAFFASYGSTNAVRLRRTPQKLFKGSVFVEFADEETAQRFLNLTSKPLWKGEYELKIMSKKAYIDQKTEEIRSGNIDPTGHEHWHRNNGRGRGRGNSRGNRGVRGNHGGRNGRQTGDRDPDNWKKRREDDRASGFKNGRNTNNGKRGRDKGRGRSENRDGRNNKGHGSDKSTENIENEGNVKSEPNDEKSNESIKIHNNDGEKSTCGEENNPRANLTDDVKQQNEPSKKRLREDNGELQQGPNKKLDIKTEASVEN